MQAIHCTPVLLQVLHWIPTAVVKYSMNQDCSAISNVLDQCTLVQLISVLQCVNESATLV